MKRSKPLARSSTPIARTPLKRSRSPQRRAKAAAMHDASEARQRLTGGLCEGHTPVCLSGRHPGDHAHHVHRRSQGGKDDVENLRWLCWEGHAWVHDNPAKAAEKGLLLLRGGKL